MITDCDGVENIVGNGENAGDKHFLLFLKCFRGFLPYGFLTLSSIIIYTCFNTLKRKALGKHFGKR